MEKDKENKLWEDIGSIKSGIESLQQKATQDRADHDRIFKELSKLNSRITTIEVKYNQMELQVRRVNYLFISAVLLPLALFALMEILKNT